MFLSGSPQRARPCRLLGHLPTLLSVLLLVGSLVCGFWGCSPSDPNRPRNSNGASADSEGKDDETETVPVRVEALIRGPISYSLLTTGDLQAEEWTDLVVRRPGIVEHLMAEEGKTVKPGEGLLVLDRREIQVALAQAEADETEAKKRAELSEAAIEESKNSVEQARIAADKAEKEYKRYSRLTRGVIQQEELETRGYEMRRTRLALDASLNARRQAGINAAIARTVARKAALSLEKARIDLEYTVLTAPFAGVISQRYVQRGQYLTANTPAFTLVNCANLKMEVKLPQRYLPLLNPGLRVSLETEAFEDIAFPATLERVCPVVGEKGTIKVTMRVSQKDLRLRPGMYVSASIVIDTHEEALLASKRGVQYDTLGGIPTVFVAREDRALKLPVKIGYRESEVLEVIPIPIPTDFTPRFTGLESLGLVMVLPQRIIAVREGDRLIVAGQDRLKGGESLKIVSSSPALGTPSEDRKRQVPSGRKDRKSSGNKRP